MTRDGVGREKVMLNAGSIVEKDCEKDPRKYQIEIFHFGSITINEFPGNELERFIQQYDRQRKLGNGPPFLYR